MFSDNPLAHKVNLGQHLSQLRTRLKLSQEKLAESVGTTARSISRWEHNQALPQHYYQEKLCQVLQIPLEVLFGFNDVAQNNTFLPDPGPLWYVPYACNAYFTGREDALLQLHERLHAKHETELTQLQIVSGLGGIGKTQMVLEYAYRFRKDYQAVLWVRAETHETLLEDYQALAALLQIPEADGQDLSRIVAAVKHKLQSYRPWLFICDGVEDLERVHTLLPDASQGHVVLTTCSQVTGTLGSHLDLQKMEPTEGTLFLLRRAKYLCLEAPLEEASAFLRTQAKAIVEAVDGLPLALDQAGAYIEESECDLLEYLDRYATRRSALLNACGAVSTYHPASVAETLSYSFQKVAQTSLVAANVLRLCAFFQADAIPEEILIWGTTKLGSVRQTTVPDALALDAAIKELRRFSLLYRTPKQKTFTIHRLMQAIIKDGMDTKTRHQWAEYAIWILNHVFPDSHDAVTWRCCQRYLPHVLACARFIEEEKIASLDAGELLYRAGIYLCRREYYTQAERLLHAALSIIQGSLGPDHPLAVRCRASMKTIFIQAEEKVESTCYATPLLPAFSTPRL